MSDIGAYATEVIFRPDLGMITKRESVDRFRRLFQNGQIVDLVFAPDDGMA